MKKNASLPKRFNIKDSYYDADFLENVSTGEIHWHSHFLISLFTRNKGTQYLNNIPFKFEPGYAILMSPFDFHYNKINDGETFDSYSIKFTHKVFNSHLYEICSPSQFPIVAKLSDSDYKLSLSLCEYLVKEKANLLLSDDKFLVKNIIEQLVALILKNADTDTIKSSSDFTIIKALIYIHDNFKEEITVKEVSDICHYTPNHFSYCFKKEMGVTFQNYLHNLRLEYAFNMLSYGNKSCSEACYESGFNSIEYFSSSFKKKYGKSPKLYKNS